MSAGTYRLIVGTHFYVGSSSNLRNRRYQHFTDLRRGIHPNKAIQAAYDAQPGVVPVVDPHRFARQGLLESDQEFRDRLRVMEQELLDDLWLEPGRCNKSRSARGPDQGDAMRRRWTNPEYRARMTARMIELRKGLVVSETTKRRMAAAKLGKGNPKARPVVFVDSSGTTTRFECVTALAAHCGVSQQLMAGYVAGLIAWPGTGRRTRKTTTHLVGCSARFEL